MGGQVAQVHDYIENQHCLEHFIRHSRPVCITPAGECLEYGSVGCEDHEHWQWQDLEQGIYHAPGVNPHPDRRITHRGDDIRKKVWAYTGAITQAAAMQIYNKEGQVTAEGLLDTPVNVISMIANVLVNASTGWFRPGQNNTNGCGQMQTWELPFGFDGNATTSLPTFQKNLKMLHEGGKTICLTMGSWCTSFPVTQEEEWEESQFEEFVDYFKKIRQDTFGGYLDGIDFDWEGYCSFECLKGANTCHCAWDDDICGEKTPEELAAGVRWESKEGTLECWRMATKSTLQIMSGITYHMKKAGFVVTLVPMSTQVYTGDEDQSDNKVMRNEFIKYRHQPYAGGKQISGDTKVNIFDLVDGYLLQWYSGFDAALCKHTKDPKACSCDNVPDEDYPNVLNLSNGLLVSYWNQNKTSGNMFPTEYPIRCGGCTGTKDGDGTKACAKPEETWFEACGNSSQCVAEHKRGLENYENHHNGSQYWWVKGVSVPSACPRSIDCPDWQYKGEKRYSRQMNLLRSIGKVIDLKKVSIGFEVLGIDVQVQLEAYADPALPWPTSTLAEQHNGTYYHKCTHNLTKTGKDEKRCGNPLLTQQWGLKFNADDVLGLDKEVQAEFGHRLAGIGFFTLDGVVAVGEGQPERLWRKELMELNKTWGIPGGHWVPVPTPSPTPPPTNAPIGFCKHDAPKNGCGACGAPSDCGSDPSDWSTCWKKKDAACGAGPPTSTGFCVHDAPSNACGACSTPEDCGAKGDWTKCWAAKDWHCGSDEAEAMFI